jgi:DNA repair protein RadC
MLNRANRVIGMEQLSNGGVSGTLVDIKLALKKSIDRLADAVVFCHNHPSETLSPSREDDNVTHRLRKAFEAVEIRVLDHVIVAGGKYYSYSDHDRLH